MWMEVLFLTEMLSVHFTYYINSVTYLQLKNM